VSAKLVQTNYCETTAPPLSKSKGRNQFTAKLSTTKHYLLQYPDKALFTLQYPWQNFQQMRLLSAKANAIIKSRQPAVPTAGIYFLQKQNCNYAFSSIKGIAN